MNQGQFIERTIRSVVSQKRSDDEYVVVDGMSTDGTYEVVRQYQSALDAFVMEKDEGQADALAKGFRLVTGDILAYLNSDDVLLPGALEFVRDFFSRHPGVDAIYGHRIFVDDEDSIMRFWLLPPHSDYCMKRWDFIPQETCFWRRQLMEKAGGIDTAYRFALDYDLFVRMMAIGRFKRVNRFLAAFREHRCSKTSARMHDVGRQEIEAVRTRYEVGSSGLMQRAVGKLFWCSIVYPSAAYRYVRIGPQSKTLDQWLKDRKPSQLSFPY